MHPRHLKALILVNFTAKAYPALDIIFFYYLLQAFKSSRAYKEYIGSVQYYTLGAGFILKRHIDICPFKHSKKLSLKFLIDVPAP